MAKQEVGLKIDVDVSSVGNMKQQLRAATNELVAMNEKFGSASKEATQAAQRVAKLKDAIGDAKALADTFNPDKKFVALGGAVQGAVSGFFALQGAMGLFGSESKDVEKLLLKVQSAMALQQGISGVAGAMDSMKLLAGTIKTQVVTAFSTLRGAIIATGLGALAVAVGLVIANFDKFKAAVFNLIPGLKGITDFVGGLVTKFTDFVGITSEAERNLEKFTKSSKRSREGIEAQIKVLEAQGGQEAKVYSLKKKNIESELNDLREAAKTKGKLTEEEQKQIRDLKLEQQILDIEEVNRKKKLAEDEAKNRKEAAEKLQKQRDEEEKIRKEKAEKLAEDRAREQREIDELLENERQALAEKEKQAEEEKQKLIEEENKRYQEVVKNNADRLLKESENEQLTFEQRIAIIQQRKSLENQIEFDSLQEKLDFTAENEAAITDIKNLEEEARIANAQFAANQLSAIAQLAGQDTAAGKALSVAAATISTYLSAQKAYESQFKPVAIVDSPIRGAIAAGVAIATGIANVKKILSVQVPGKGGAGKGGGGAAGISTAAPIAPQLATAVEATQVNTAAVNQMGNRAARAYVLNSDIQNENQRNAYIDRNASLGGS